MVAITFQPLRAKSKDVAFPIPEDAPVINTVFLHMYLFILLNAR